MRRSSRQQPPLPPTRGSSTSGPSSTASARLERSTRANNKQASPQKSTTPHSNLSSDNNDTEDGSAPLARRSKRGQQDTGKTEEDNIPKVEDGDMDDDQVEEEEEVTRCLCGQAEYPGPPEVRNKSDHPALDVQGEDAGGLFIQCDVCKVWQHGGCVGIMDEAASPDDYFCEQCRPQYHEVSTAKNGQKYSLYLPVYEKLYAKSSHRKSSASRESDMRAAKEKEKALRAEALAKRRSTMNSRSAYDEEEVLRAVLEQSKNDGGTAGSDAGTRKGKRARDDSEDTSKDPKRQRTVSELSSDNEDNQSPAAESDNDAKSGKQKPRGAAARSHRDKEQREKTREPLDAAGKRKGRSERRRGDDSEPPESILRPSVPPSDVDAPTSQPSDTPQLGPTSSKSHKKGAKASSKRGKNQWTRDNTQTPQDADAPAVNGERRSRRGAGEDTSPPRNARSGENTDGGANSKEATEAEGAVQPAPVTTKGHGRTKGPKQLNVHKTSMNEMRRRINTMLQAVSQAQVDLAGKKSYQLAVNSALNGTVEKESTAVTNPGQPTKEAEKENRADQHQTGGSTSNSSSSTRGFNISFEEFEKLPHTEMANLLSTQLVLWQQEFGKVGEK